jgi:uncharacterized protein with FMN-binding domain
MKKIKKMKKISGISLSILRTVHLLFIVLFFGGLAVLLVILEFKSSGSLILSSAEVDLIIYRLNGNLIYYSFLGLTTTAIIYGLFTNWGILKHRWIIIKWVLLFTIAGIYIIVFSPSINGIVSLSSGGLNSREAETLYEVLLRKSISSNITLISILLIIFFISTLKPFGRRIYDLLSENKIARISIFVLLMLSVGFGIMGSLNLNRLRSMEINNPDLTNTDNGIYKGEFNDGAGIYTVEVEVNNHRISQVKMETERKSVYVNYARPIIDIIVKQQTVNVDAITGATTTSKCIMKAAENALKKAGTGDHLTK